MKMVLIERILMTLEVVLVTAEMVVILEIMVLKQVVLEMAREAKLGIEIHRFSFESVNGGRKSWGLR